VVSRRQLPGSEGAVLQLQQWGNLLLYVTQQGGVHAWDLRMRGDAWLLTTQPSQGLAEQLVADPSGGWHVHGELLCMRTSWGHQH
jgi:hypothetical protein